MVVTDRIRAHISKITVFSRGLSQRGTICARELALSLSRHPPWGEGLHTDHL